ncbi:MAG: hypothetical protein ACRCX2_34655 [Paraclostridium sp.]
MRKEAGVTAKSIDDLVDILGKSKIKGDPKKLADKALFNDNGTGSFILDMVGLKNKKSFKKVNGAYEKVQRTLADADMKAGYKAHKYLSGKKSGMAKGLGNSLLSDHEFITDSVKGTPDKSIKVRSAKITQPLTKAKNAIVPMAGTMALANAVHSPKKDGDNDEF